jgi:hypothetical protein
VYRSQLAVTEQVLETAALMLSGDKVRGHCLEMICADFLAGAELGSQSETMLLALYRLYQLLPEALKHKLCADLRKSA